MKYLKYFEKIHVAHISMSLSTLKDLDIPKFIDGQFNCTGNKLTSLEFCSEHVGGSFFCFNNKLTSLEFCPKFVGSNFNCNCNELTSLEFCPENINGDFSCALNNLTSLEFCPKYIIGKFKCSNNYLTSLDFYPEYIGGKFECHDNNWTNPIPFDIIEKLYIDIYTLYADDQKEKFGAYEYQKEFLTNTPEKYKDLEIIGYNEKIKKEFDWIFNAIDMGLM